MKSLDCSVQAVLLRQAAFWTVCIAHSFWTCHVKRRSIVTRPEEKKLSRTRSKCSELGYTVSLCRSNPWWAFHCFQQQAILPTLPGETVHEEQHNTQSYSVRQAWAGKKRLEKKQKTEKDLPIAEALKSNDQPVHPKGEMLPQDKCIYRVKVVNTSLHSGVPLNKISDFWDFTGGACILLKTDDTCPTFFRPKNTHKSRTRPMESQCQ